jgi:hypothetical protein
MPFCFPSCFTLLSRRSYTSLSSVVDFGLRRFFYFPAGFMMILNEYHYQKGGECLEQIP